MIRYLSIALLLVMTASANAAVNTYFTEVNTLDIGGADYRVWDMMVDVGGDWTNSRVDLTLTSGNLYQDALGRDVEPYPHFFPLYHSLEWDTYVTTPGGWAGLVGLAGARPFMTDTSITASWFDLADGPGTWKIARVTLSNDAEGTIWSKSYDVDTPGCGADYSFIIEDGQIVPEPAALMGDADHSGHVDDHDLSLLLANWGLDIDWGGGEFNGIPPIGDDDLSLVLSHWNEGTICPSSWRWPDFDGNGMIGDDDLSLMLANWGNTGVEWNDGDATEDGEIDDDDLSVLLPYWHGGTPPAPDAVPEPATTALLLLGGLSLLRRNRQ